MEHLPAVITRLFLKLRDDKEFWDELPLYSPNPKLLQTGITI